MPVYIFLTNSICFIGGGQKYIENKVKRLKQAGYQTVVISTVEGKIYLDSLKCFKKTIIPETRFHPYNFPEKSINDIIRLIKRNIPNTNEEILIESNSITLAEWGDLLAREINAKHICIILQEKIKESDLSLDFINFKVKRKEFYVINKEIINKLKLTNPIDYDCIIIAECTTNAIEDIPEDISHLIPKGCYNIGSISRLDKPFLQKAIKDLLEYISLHEDKRFNLILIGDGSIKTKRMIKKYANANHNLNIMITGYLCPIPLKLINNINCFLSSAGAAYVTANIDIPTISFSPTGDPLGIVNYTTSEVLYDKSSIKHSLEYYLDKILYENFCQKTNMMMKSNTSIDFESEFKRQLSLFHDHVKEFYDFRKAIKKYKNTLSPYIYIFVKLFGTKFFIFVYNLLYKSRIR